METDDGELDDRSLPRALTALGELLGSRGLSYEVVAVGGSALLLLGFIHRATRDLDLVAFVDAGRLVRADRLPAPLAESVADVARVLGLRVDWLNRGPASLLDLGLPEGFAQRLETRRYGGLTLHLASRLDHIALKLYAAVDQGPDSKHAADLLALAPSQDELLGSARWARTHDSSEAFRSQLVQALRHFGAEPDGTV